MKLFVKVLFFTVIVLVAFLPAAMANDFDWTGKFNRQAMADPPEFMAKLAARFDLSEMQVIALRNIFASPADAYIMLRLGEMQGDLKKITKEQAIAAINLYRNNKGKGWENLAEKLGIASGSREFLALKRGHDLQNLYNPDQFAYRDRDFNNDRF